MTVTAPMISPPTAPLPDIFLQVSDSRIMGPKAAPKPAQAWLTSPSTCESGSRAMTAATRPTSTTQMRLTVTVSFSVRSEEHTSELQSRGHLVCRLLLEQQKESPC